MRRRDGFTLIELLIVVSIIALLISILLPSLSRARKQARSTVCLANLRTLSHGWHMYADDNRDILLPGRYAKLSGGTANPANWYTVGNGLKYRPRWAATMGGYVGVAAFSRPSTSEDRQDYDSRVYQCPQVPDWMDERNYAYGYNYQFLGNARRSNGRFHNFPVNRSVIRSFTNTVMAADCMGTAAGVPAAQRQAYENDGKAFNALGNHGWSLDPPGLTPESDRGSGDSGSPRTAVHARHLKKTNAVFCDGHGETVTPRQLGYVIEEDGAYSDQGSNHRFSGRGHDKPPPAIR